MASWKVASCCLTLIICLIVIETVHSKPLSSAENVVLDSGNLSLLSGVKRMLKRSAVYGNSYPTQLDEERERRIFRRIANKAREMVNKIKNKRTDNQLSPSSA